MATYTLTEKIALLQQAQYMEKNAYWGDLLGAAAGAANKGIQGFMHNKYVKPVADRNRLMGVADQFFKSTGSDAYGTMKQDKFEKAFNDFANQHVKNRGGAADIIQLRDMLNSPYGASSMPTEFEAGGLGGWLARTIGSGYENRGGERNITRVNPETGKYENSSWIKGITPSGNPTVKPAGGWFKNTFMAPLDLGYSMLKSKNPQYQDLLDRINLHRSTNPIPIPQQEKKIDLMTPMLAFAGSNLLGGMMGA